ncbi:hypothetical protein [Catalinimonas niigatensis]|uniref:hypothetical protein n=1 Tax=Catalinimonas niigatensis TaxID=1397264 RepID=UPI002665090B|nr:hypothetical protein [Catalinimonas niigatensis]WPP49675.1 hypothetical protein PZB72_23660 [Catalinimonas niigatensis]
MKTFDIKLLFFLLSFLPISLSAQDMSNPAKQQNLDNLAKDGYSGMVQTYDTRYEGVKGSPYLTKNWLEGKVELEEGRSITNIELLYNVYTDELIGRNKGKKPVVIDRGMVRSFTMGKKDNANMGDFIKVDYLDYQLEDVKEHQYVQELYKGETALYAVNKKLLKKANYEGAYSAGEKYDEFSALQADYYFVNPEGEVYKFKPNKRSVVRAMKDKKEAISNYIEVENLNLNERDDLVKLVMYYEIQQKD